MKILVYMGHPAQYHYFKHIIWELEKRGHMFYVVAVKKDVLTKLLKKSGFNYYLFGKSEQAKWRKIIDFSMVDISLIKASKKWYPDMFLSATLPYPAHAGFILRKPVIGVADTEHSFLNYTLSLPFTDVVLTPNSFLRDIGKKQIRFDGYLELLYLHPNWFKPDPAVLDELGVSKDDKYVIVRFVSWTASHDVGQKGLGLTEKIRLIHEIEKHAIPMITSEMSLPKDLEKYKIKIPPHRIHDALYYASMYIGEGATMASEAALLGTPSIFIHPMAGLLGTTRELEERYNLMINIKNLDMNTVLDFVEENINSKEIWALRAKKMLEEKIDVTSFLIWFIENYPESAEIMRENPKYQERFK